MPIIHRFQVGNIVKANSSGKFYRVTELLHAHLKLNGNIGYRVVGRRDGKDFGPYRVMPETSFTITAYKSELMKT